jgi:hypothetical protein
LFLMTTYLPVSLASHSHKEVVKWQLNSLKDARCLVNAIIIEINQLRTYSIISSLLIRSFHLELVQGRTVRLE